MYFIKYLKSVADKKKCVDDEGYKALSTNNKYFVINSESYLGNVIVYTLKGHYVGDFKSHMFKFVEEIRNDRINKIL